jgi:hypothetical protein
MLTQFGEFDASLMEMYQLLRRRRRFFVSSAGVLHTRVFHSSKSKSSHTKQFWLWRAVAWRHCSWFNFQGWRGVD